MNFNYPVLLLCMEEQKKLLLNRSIVKSMTYVFPGQ